MKRREFITLLGGAARWPLAARAQQAERIRRIGVLMPSAQTIGNLRLASRRSRRGCSNLAGPMAATCGSTTVGPQAMPIASQICGGIGRARTGRYSGRRQPARPLQQATRTVPIVFVIIVDPVGAGFVENLARPGSNATGFILFEYGMGGEMARAAQRDRAAVDARGGHSRPGYFLRGRPVRRHPGRSAVIRSGVAPRRCRRRRRDRAGHHRFRAPPNGGLIVTGSPLTLVHRDLIIALAARHRLPAVYSFRYFAAGGGLISYGPDQTEPFRRAASYIDRILKGEKPADLPVQAPTKYELVINLKTAKALGLEIPPMLLARADEVIE